MKVTTFLTHYTQKLIDYIDTIKNNEIIYQLTIPFIDINEDKYQTTINIQPNIYLTKEVIIDLAKELPYNLADIQIMHQSNTTQIHLNIIRSLIDLPQDILSYEILLHLDYEDVINTCLTSVSLNKICQSNNFWREKFLNDFGYQPPDPRFNDTMRDVYRESNNLLGFAHKNYYGSLANVDENHYIKINNQFFKVKAIACGFYHSLVIDMHDVVWSFGLNGDKQLGRQGKGNIPMHVNIDKKAKMIACGFLHTLMISTY